MFIFYIKIGYLYIVLHYVTKASRELMCKDFMMARLKTYFFRGLPVSSNSSKESCSPVGL
jgi:hypothetical protein